MKICDIDLLINRMYYEAFENDESYNEENPMAKWDSGLWIRFKLFENVIDDLPIKDIVRCKECVDYDGDDWCMYWQNVINPDDYCSYGERKE